MDTGLAAEEPPTHWLPLLDIPAHPPVGLPPTLSLDHSLPLSSFSSPFPLTPTPAPPTQLLRLIFTPPPPLATSFLRDGGRSTGLGCCCSVAAVLLRARTGFCRTPTYTGLLYTESTTSMVFGLLFLSRFILVATICSIQIYF